MCSCVIIWARFPNCCFVCSHRSIVSSWHSESNGWTNGWNSKTLMVSMLDNYFLSWTMSSNFKAPLYDDHSRAFLSHWPFSTAYHIRQNGHFCLMTRCSATIMIPLLQMRYFSRKFWPEETAAIFDFENWIIFLLPFLPVIQLLNIYS